MNNSKKSNKNQSVQSQLSQLELTPNKPQNLGCVQLTLDELEFISGGMKRFEELR